MSNKLCRACFIEKPITDFGVVRDKYFRSHCKICHAKNTRDYAARNREVVRAKKRAYSRKNRAEIIGAQKLWRYNNPEKVKATSRKAYEKRRGAHAALIAGRRSRLLSATPKWADKAKMREFYKSADGLQMLTGEWYHVDHIVPLQGKFVCGLHCEFNLQIIPKRENLRKHNRFNV